MARKSLIAVLVVGILFIFIGANFSACAARDRLGDREVPTGPNSQDLQTEEGGIQNEEDQSDLDHPWGGAGPNHDDHRYDSDSVIGCNGFIIIPASGKAVFYFYLGKLAMGKRTHLVR